MKKKIRKLYSHIVKGLFCFSFLTISVSPVLAAESSIVDKNAASNSQQQAPKIRVKGTVTDESGEAQIGVLVQVKGAATATQTDGNGAYSLDVPGDAKLVFTMMGFKMQEISVNGKTTVNVKLETAITELETVEIISDGFRTIDRKMFTGSASKVGEEAKTAGTADAGKMLQGKVPGIQQVNVSGTFGAAPKLRVRGPSSIYGNSNPLWVVDGVVLDEVVNVDADDLASGNAETLISSGVAGLNADDIESFQILKDASATALYGARAMNGVIVITTKKGRKGTATFNYTGEFVSRLKPNYSQYDIINSKEQMSVFLEMREKGLLESANMFLAQDGGVINKLYRLTDLYSTSEGQYGLNNSTSSIMAYLQAAEMRNTDWFDALFKNTVTQNHSISASLGTDKASGYISASYMNDPGWTMVDKVDRYTVNANVNYEFSPKVSVGISGNASIRNQMAPGTFSRSMNVVDGEYTRDFDINPFSYALNASRMLDKDTYYRRNYADFNIFNEMKNNYLMLDMMDTKLQIDLSYKPIKNVEINALGSFRYAKSTREHNIGNNSNMALAYRAAESTSIIKSNNFLWQNPDAPDDLPEIVLGRGSFYNTYDNQLKSYYGRLSGNYNLVKGNFALNFLGGAELRAADRLDRFNYGYGYLWSSEMAITDYRIIRKIIDAGGTYFGMNQTYDRSVGVFAAATGSYLGKYTLNATIRTEGTNQMGKSNKARWLPTWNLSGAWNIYGENFMRATDNILSALKLRGTYGLTAKMSPYVNVDAVYQATQTYRPYQYDREVMYEILNLANNDLTWEKMLETNLGVDFGILKNRISVIFDIYWRNSYDLIGIMQTSGLGGEPRKLANYADLKSHGYEFSISTLNMKTQDFTWTNTLIFSFNENRVENMENYQRLYQLVGLDGAPRNDYPVRSLFSIPFKGLDENGLPMFYNTADHSGDGVYYIDFQDSQEMDYLKYEGSIDPTITGGFENSLKYKNFKLDLFFSYQMGNVIRLYPTFKASYSDMDAMTQDIRNRWTLPGDEKITNIPTIPSADLLRQNGNLAVAYNAYNFSDLRVAKGDFIRLKDITFTYDFNKEFINAWRIGLRNLQLRLVASNVWLIYSDKRLNGQDPEFSRSGGVAMPTPKQLTFSIKAGF